MTAGTRAKYRALESTEHHPERHAERKTPMKTNPTTYGYIVIPDGDNTSRADQLKAVEEFVPDCILMDREHRTKTDRTSLEHIMGMLRPNDVLVTAKMSNLGRSYTEILENWNRIMERLAFIVILEPPAVETRPGKQRSEKTATEFLSLLVEMEKKRISKVTEGLKAAKLKGVTPGPKRKIPPEFYNVKERWQNQEISGREAGRLLGISHRTFMRWAEDS